MNDLGSFQQRSLPNKWFSAVGDLPLPPRDIWQHLQTFLIIETVGDTAGI